MRLAQGIFFLHWGPPPGSAPGDAVYEIAAEAAQDAAAVLAYNAMAELPKEDPELLPDPEDPDYVPSEVSPHGEDMQKLSQIANETASEAEPDDLYDDAPQVAPVPVGPLVFPPGARTLPIEPTE